MRIIMKNIILRPMTTIMRNRTNTMTIIMKNPQKFIMMMLLITMMFT
jgi:hypothetical protein